jgi:hypothetical protein
VLSTGKLAGPFGKAAGDLENLPMVIHQMYLAQQKCDHGVIY